MAIFIPEDKTSEIKQASDIIEIISEVVILKKAGRNYVGLCPFHSEKTASFTVSPEKQIFYCFGCGVGGDVFSFVMKYQQLSFPEAQRFLAGRYGVEIPTQQVSPAQRKCMTEKEALINMNHQAMEFFQHCLKQSPSGKKAMAYLERRGITETTISHFHLGYAPEGWTHLVDVFMKKQIPVERIKTSGLAVPRKNQSGFYDRFRDRIIFPIMDTGMKVIGFGGRALDDSLPKYLNSPETPLYNKSRSLYGLSQARHKCRQDNSVYITEGYFDQLTLYQHGFENTVATLGTALTMEHIRLLKGYAARMILVYDSDNAGIKAAMRSVSVFMNEQVEARILILPTGHDPDSFLVESGAEAFAEMASGAMTVIEFLIDSSIKRCGLTVEGKIRIVSELSVPIASVMDSVAKSLYVKDLAERIGIDEAVVWQKIDAVDTGKTNGAWPVRNTQRISAANARQQTATEMGGGSGRSDRMERQIIAMMLQFPEILPVVGEQNILDHIYDDALKFIGKLVLERANRYDGKASDIVSLIEDESIRNIAASLAIGHEPWDREGCLKLIDQFEISRSRREKILLQKIKAAEQGNNYNLLNDLLRKKQIQAQQRQ
ncbi:MAG: DNA primase [Desulfobacterales bacterium]|nr:DNA primase [Desulfobacterales bacterium]MDD4071807.1 DNA primase [Desulfobacterales bacterium]MDD4393395.1 DNA primase [Desulfobacterales bacterium]